MVSETKWSTNTSNEEQSRNQRLLNIASKSLPKFGHDWNADSNVFMRRQTLSRILLFSELYKEIVPIPGAIMDFGTKWGASMSLMMGFRGIYEPYNFNRELFGFDTFSGFPDVDVLDGSRVKEGDLSTELAWELTLKQILELHKQDQPLKDLLVTEVVKGDIRQTLTNVLDENPHMVISLAIFDFDLYSPTKFVLEKILSKMPKGSILYFDEFNTRLFPGETVAVHEILGINNLSIRRSPLIPTAAWVVVN